MTNTPRWEALPDPALDVIAKKVICIKDYICFGVVCKSWHSITRDRRHRRTSANLHQLPLLLISSRANDPTRRGLYSAHEKRTYVSEVQVVHQERFCGSSHGWIIFTNSESSTISALNPFSGIRKDISPMIIDEYITKAVFSDGPDASSFAIMIIYGEDQKLAMLKSGASTWTFFSAKQRLIQDIIFSNGKAFAVETWGRVFVFDMDGNNLTTLEYPFPPFICLCIQDFTKHYIVESLEGNMIQVVRYFPDNHDENGLYWTISFYIFKRVCALDGQPRWEQVESLGDSALFIGDNHSMIISTTEFPGCQPNSIYYTDDGSGPLISAVEYEESGTYDIGVYNIGTRAVSRHYVPNEAQRFMPPPVWVIPTLKKH